MLNAFFFTCIYIYIYTDTNPITLPCSLARGGKKETSMEAVVEFKHPLFQLELNTMAGFALVTQSTLQKMATSIEAVSVF